MHVLVTGGAGFIGSHLVEHHLNKGDTVYAVDDLSTGSQANVDLFNDHPKYRFQQADILTWDEIEKAVGWADRIYHLAAVVGVYKVIAEPVKVLAVNIAATERLLRAVNKSGWKPRVMITSSSEVYGPTGAPLLKEDANLIIESGANNRWNYAISKLANEAQGLSYHRKHNIDITTVRFFNTIGPRQTGRYGMVVPRFVQQAVNGEPITVFGDGNQTRSFCDVRDTVVILDELLASEKSIGEIVNVGYDREITINELANLVIKITKSKSKIKHIPYNEAYGMEYVDIQRRRPDLIKLKSLVNHPYKWDLENTIQFLSEQYKNS